MDAYLSKIYGDPGHEAGFGGAEKLYRYVKKDGVYKMTRKQVREWLAGNETYTLHRPVRKKFTKSRVMAYAMDELWQLDLVDMASLSRYNSGYKYLLTCIDVLSKFAWVIPLKDKTGKSLVKALKKILKSKREPVYIQTDKGTEFTNRLFQSFLKDKGIHFYTTHNTTKASVIERYNRTLKEKMNKYFTHRDTSKYINMLPRFVRAYNHSYHRSIQTKPILVTKENEGSIWKTLYMKKKREKKKKPQYIVGDRVRISRAKHTFEKGYRPNWTREVFNVTKPKMRGVPVYDLEDDLGEKVTGTFYEPELQKVKKDKEGLFRVEKILKSRTRHGKKEDRKSVV